MNVLVIEDDTSVATFIHDGFVQHGHSVVMAHDGKDGLALGLENTFDVIVLDRMLPNLDGMSVLNQLRENGIQTPTVILSAKDKVTDKITGLRAGADDYMTKPFAFEELLARTEVMIARRTPEQQLTTLQASDLSLDLIKRTVTRGDHTIELQSKEFKLLEYLLHNKGKIITRTMLLENVWEYNFDPQTNIIDVHISRLRNKVDKGHEHAIIQTVRGAGYLIAD